MSSLPTPIRAALGVALTVVDTARDTATHLPQKAAGLPVAVASQAVQLSLRAQQQYAAYVNKGDELIGAFRGAPEEPPAWATFDDDEPAGPTPARNTAFDRVPDAEDELEELRALDDLTDLAAELADDADADVIPLVTGGGIEDELTVADLERPTDDDLARLGPPATPGAPDTTSTEPEVVARDDAGDEVFGADAPRSTANRAPSGRPTRKTATKSARKSTGSGALPAKKAAGKAAKTAPTTGAGATGGLPAAPAVKASAPAAKKAAKAAKKAAKKAPPAKKVAPGDAAPGEPTAPGGAAPAKKAAKKAPPAKKAPAKKAAAPTEPAPADPTPAATPPAPDVSDTQPGSDRPDQL